MTTWNPSDKSPSITLTNGNLTATTSTATAQGVRSTTAYGTGKKFFEITLNAITVDTGIGLATANYFLADGNQIGGSTDGGNAVGYYPITPPQGIYTLGVQRSVGTGSDVTGAIISVAVDFDAKKVWFTSPEMRAEGHAWNNGVLANQNPATGVGGIDISGLQPGPFFIIVVDLDGGGKYTQNTAGNFSVNVPSGYASWDVAPPAPAPTPTPPPAATQAFDPAHTNSQNTLSNSNLTMTHTGSDGVIGTALCVLPKTSGKWYWEVHLTGTEPWRIGIANYNLVLSDGVTLGGSPNAMSWESNFGIVNYNSVQQGTIATFTAGDVLSVALDLDNHKIWFRVNNGGWNNAVLASQNPAANVGGFAVNSAIYTSGCVPAATLQTNGDTITMTFVQTGWQFVSPSGFSAFNPISPPTPAPTPTPTPVPTPTPTPSPSLASVTLPGSSATTQAVQPGIAGTSSNQIRLPATTLRTTAVWPSSAPPITATATGLISASLVGSVHRYDVTINNVGSTTIGTFWFAWDDNPEKNLMSSPPLSVSVPNGWAFAVTHLGTNDGYGIEFTTASPAISGSTISGFSFTSAMTPAQMFAASAIDPSFQVTSSLVYITTAFSDAGYTFFLPQFVSPAPTPGPTPTPVPTPAPRPSPPVGPSVSQALFTNWWQAMINELVANKDLLYGFIVDSGDPQGLTGQPDTGVLNTPAALIISNGFKVLEPTTITPTPAPTPVPGPPAPQPAPTPPAPVPTPTPAPTPTPPVPTPSPTPSGESPQGSILTSTAGSIQDGAGNVWTLNNGTGLEVFENNQAAGFSANVVLLLYWNHTVYQQNSAGGWWFWNSSTWIDTSDPRIPTPVPTPVGPTPPPAAGANVVIGLTSFTGKLVSPFIWGVGTEGLGSPGQDDYRAASNAGWQATYRQQNWRLFRFNTEGDIPLWTGQNSVINNWFNGLPQFWTNVTSATDMTSPRNRVMFTLGSQPRTVSGSQAAGIANLFKSHNNECFFWEFWNEPDGDLNGYMSQFDAVRNALKAVNSSYQVGGPTTSFARSDFFSALQSHNPDFISYHTYFNGSYSNNTSLFNQTLSRQQGDLNMIKQYFPTKPIFLGEWNIDYSGNEQMMQTIDGAIFGALYTTGAYLINQNVQMGAIWTIGENNKFTIVNDDGSDVRPMGYMLGQLGQVMGGNQVSASIGPSLSSVLCLASVTSTTFAVQLINYGTNAQSITLQGLPVGSATYWELSPSHTTPFSQTIQIGGNGVAMALPGRSIITVTGTLS